MPENRFGNVEKAALQDMVRTQLHVLAGHGAGDVFVGWDDDTNAPVVMMFAANTHPEDLREDTWSFLEGLVRRVFGDREFDSFTGYVRTVTEYGDAVTISVPNAPDDDAGLSILCEHMDEFRGDGAIAEGGDDTAVA